MQQVFTPIHQTYNKLISDSEGKRFSILHIATDMDPAKGGVCQSVRTMIAGLSELDIYNELVSLDNADASYIRDDNFIINACGEGKGPWRYNTAYLHWLYANMYRFDVVIVHGLWLYHSYSARKAWMQLKKQRSTASKKAPRLFIMPHGMLDPYFQQAGGRKVKAIRNLMYWKLLEQKIVNGADGMLFTSDEERLLARKPFSPYRPKREVVVGLGTDEPPLFIASMRHAFLDRCPGINGRPYLLFLSRIHEKKGVEMLVEAYKNIVIDAIAAGNEVSTRLVIAGPGAETAYGQAIQQQVNAAPEIKDLVFFPGMLKGDAKWGAFYGCDAFVLPSHQENFGIAVAEAMACAKPVLISNQVNIWQPIKASGGGLVENDSYEGTQALLHKWQNLSTDLKKAMGMKARNCFEKEFAVGPASIRMAAALIG